MNYRIVTPSYFYIAPDMAPCGIITPFAGSTAPYGYLLCDGSAVSRTRYSALFSVISTLYGSGDGSTTFNLPNMTSRFPIGADGTYSLASTGGSTQENLTNVNQIPLHNHGINDPGHSHAVSDPGHNHTVSDPGHGHTSNAVGGQGNLGLCIANGSNTVIDTDASGGELNVWTTPYALNINNNTTGITVNSRTTGVSVNSQTTGITTQNNGASPTAPFDILNPYLALNYIIKF